MQLLGQRRRSWNWRRILKKLRGGIVAVLASVPLLLFIGLVYLVMAFNRLVGRRDRPALTAFTPASDRNNVSEQTALASGPNRLALRPPDGSVGTRSSVPEKSAKNDHTDVRDVPGSARQAREASDEAIASNLALCRTPAALTAVVEEALHRNELHQQMLEVVYGRFIDLDAIADDVRALMGVCSYEWLYEMPIKRRRFIRLKPRSGSGRIIWQHLATHLICFEFDAAAVERQRLPRIERLGWQKRIYFYFDADDQLVGWEQARSN